MSNRSAILLLDNIRSVHNVGSIFRTAETLGISKIYCVGTTPVPVDRFGRKRLDFAKVALGAEDIVQWEHMEDAEALALIEESKTRSSGSSSEGGLKIIVLEQDARSIDYKEVRATEKTMIIFGNEVDGVSRALLRTADVVAEISLKGKKESLNVSVAAGIFLYRLLDQ